MRTTRAQVQAAFERAMEDLCLPYGDRPDLGHTYWLDYAACYGGYQIERTAANGAVSLPFGTGRRKATEMLAFLEGLQYAAYAFRTPSTRDDMAPTWSGS